ncbi:hypothetical protein Hanom_Chr11g01049971 [Helianthus anomalus]
MPEKNVMVDPNPPVVVEKKGTNASGSKSFRATLLGIDEEQKALEIIVSREIEMRSSWNNLGLVGRVIDFKTLTNLRNWLSMAVNMKITIKYLGGFVIVLVFQSDEDKVWFLENKGLWSSVFHSLEVWEGQILEFERIAWIKLYGVPTCLIVEQVSMEIGSKFGEVIQCPNASDADEDLSYVLVGILCKSVNRIHQNVNLRWKDMIFPVLVDEDPGEWIPDCLVDIEEVVSDEEDDGADVTMPMVDVSPAKNIDVVFDADLVGANKEDLVQQSMNVSKSVGKDGEISGSIQETFQSHFSRRNPSISPLGHDRPKKGPEESMIYLIWTDLFLVIVKAQLTGMWHWIIMEPK